MLPFYNQKIAIGGRECLTETQAISKNKKQDIDRCYQRKKK